MNIYVVDADESTRSMLLYVLGEQSYTTNGFESAESFKAAIRKQLPNLILLDRAMPEEDGLTLLKWLKSDRRTASVPVILLMNQATEMDKVIGLDHGADDCISKPFGILELLSRIHAILRRTEQRTAPSDEIQRVYQDIIVYPNRHLVTQATRVSDKTAFFLLGEVVEFNETAELFSMPKDQRTENYITGRFG